MFRSKISSWERTDMKLYNRGSSYYTILTIPRCLVSEYGKKQIWKSLRTNDYKLAKLRAEFETMAIRQKLLNDVKKIKAQNQTADLYFDDDDEETDDIQVEDKMDFSQFSDEDFLNADDKTISLMGNETFSKYHKIKYAYDKKMARINKIRNSTIEYDQREAEDFAYDWLLAKAQHETKRLQNVTNKAEERKYYQDLLNAFEYKYTQWDYRDIENEVKTYFYEKIISQPSPDTKDIVLNAFNPNSIIGRRKISAFCISNFVENANNYILAKDEYKTLMPEISKTLSEILKLSPENITKMLMWPVYAMRNSFNAFFSSGTKGMGGIGVSNFIAESLKKTVNKDLQLELTISEENVQIANALNAT